MEAERAEYTAALKAIDERPPRFEASFTWLTPAQLRHLTGPSGSFRLIADEVATRVTRRTMTALVVTQITPGSARLRLQVKRVVAPRGWTVTDPTDITILGKAAGRRPSAFVEWTLAGAGAGAIVPLHGDGRIVLSPERLFVRKPGGKNVEISIAEARENPVVFLSPAVTG